MVDAADLRVHGRAGHVVGHCDEHLDPTVFVDSGWPIAPCARAGDRRVEDGAYHLDEQPRADVRLAGQPWVAVIQLAVGHDRSGDDLRRARAR
jgi:hypothetical protein